MAHLDPRRAGAARAAHPSDDTLERLVLGMIRDPSELVPLEEHLLACPECVARTEAWEEFVWTIRSSLFQSAPDILKSRG